MKLMILDSKENAELLGGLLSPYYEVVVETNENAVLKRAGAERPNILLISTDFSEKGWENTVSALRREIPGLADAAVMVLAASASSETVNAVHRLNADMTVRPFDPLVFLAALSASAQRRVPLKEKKDKLTGLHKKGFTEGKIREEIGKAPGLMFMVEVAKYSFAVCHMEDSVLKACAEVIRAETEQCGGTLGIAAGNRFIGFIPNISDRDKGISWGNALAEKIKSAVSENLYISVGLAESDGNPESYPDLYQLCDKALGLSRASAKTAASYY